MSNKASSQKREHRLRGFCSLVLFLALSVAPLTDLTSARAQGQTVSYVCPMHSEVKATAPGKCPRCGMSLRLRDEDATSVTGNSDSSGVLDTTRIPDTIVYDQDGRRLHFYNDLVKGKVVAINFIFTTCTTICPPLTATFRKVQQELTAKAGQNVALISISVDPVTDVPERLKAFASKFNAGPGWTFITGGKPEIDQLLKALGAAAGGKTDHTPMVLVGNEAAGYWTRTNGLAAPSTLVKEISGAAARMPPAIAHATPAKSAPETAAGYFPNTVLLTEDNVPIRFFDDLLKGKTVMINFMFTTCTGVCPAMTANLAKVQEYLGERVGKDINMISISVDPVVDTPGVLKKYAANYKVKRGWYFLTGAKPDIDLVLRKVGGFVEQKTDHTSILIIGNSRTGEWAKMFAMARPAEIVDMVLKVAASK